MSGRLLAGLALLAMAGCTGSVNPTPTPPATATPTATASAAPSATPSASPTPDATPSTAPSATSPIGQMTHKRWVHTATALVDGRVLVAGGYDGIAVTATAEVYDPATSTFSATASIATARAYDTATRLLDGRVLFAGGNPGNWDFAGPMISSAELYDPTAGTFSPTGSMTTARDAHTATLLLDGRVLITGGEDAFRHPLASAELYDPTAGTFSPTGSLTAARSFHVATLLADGRVLVTGGSPFGMHAAAGHNLTSAEVYDPETGKFSPTGSIATERASHTATLLADDRILITGGAASTASDAGSFSLASAELYDPISRTFMPTGSMSFARTFQEATLLADDRVLVTGGSADGWGCCDHNYAEAEIYDPATGTFTATGSMADALVLQTATLLNDGRVLIAGGRREGLDDVIATVTAAELYDPTTGTFRPID